MPYSGERGEKHGEVCPQTFPSKEYELIDRLQKCLPKVKNANYETTIGDDAAIRVGDPVYNKLIITSDISVENVHFSTDTATFEEIGYKAMVSNLSDCAAMGAMPDSAVVQLVFPQKNDDYAEHIIKIYIGFAEACERWNFPIVGGDLSIGDVWTIGITLIGKAALNERVVKRTGVANGDALWVGGIPGESAAGLTCLRQWGKHNTPKRYQRLVDAHIRPSPKIKEGAALAAHKSIHAMMDLSDGLSKDIGTLCFDNNLGFIFDTGLQPSPEMKLLSEELNRDWQDWYYHGGEEYELLVSCEPSFNPNNIINNGHGGKASMIKLGRFTSELVGLHTQCSDGKFEKTASKSWDHCIKNGRDFSLP